VRIRLPGAQQPLIYTNQLTLYESSGWVRGGPVHDANVGALLAGLRVRGVRDVIFSTGSDPVDFNLAGLEAMAVAAGLSDNGAGPFTLREQATVLLSPPGPATPPPCQRLNDGARIYVVQGPAIGLDAKDMRYPGSPHQHSRLICPGRPALTYP
jgi:hypothetical protein